MRNLAHCTTNDLTTFQTEAETQAYRAHIERWQTELHPNGDLECHFAAEIARTAWRMEHYQALGPAETAPDEARTAWQRYRNQMSLDIRRNLEELRRIQSDRYLQAHLGILLPGLASLKIVLPGLKLPKQQPETANRPDKPESADIQRSETMLHTQIQDEERRQLAEFAKKQPQETPQPVAATPNLPSPKPAAPRNAPCPCNSGRKYKVCCGHWSKSTLPKAA